MNIEEMIALLKGGSMSADEFKEQLALSQLKDLGDVVVDLQRSMRCGLPEVIFGSSKSVDQVLSASKVILENSNEKK